MDLTQQVPQQFTLFCAVQRSTELFKGERKRLLTGVFSTERKDLHGEIMRIVGMDFTPYLRKGRVNYDHLPGPQYILGRPLEARIVTDVSKFNKDLSGPGGYHVAELYDTEPGRAAWDLIKAEEHDENRQHGWSVQGAILKSSGEELLETRVEDMALAPQPANVDTYVVTLEKSLILTNEPALELQNLDDNQGIGVESQESPAITGDFDMEDLIWGHCNNHCFDHNGKFRRGAKSLYFHLVQCKGVPEDQAFGLVTGLKKAKYLK